MAETEAAAAPDTDTTEPDDKEAAGTEPEGKEAAPAEPEAEPKNEEARRYSRQFAALSRQQKAFKEQQQAWEHEKAAKARDFQELETYRALRRQAHEGNPDAWLQAGSWNYDKLSQHYTKAGKTPEGVRQDGTASEVAELKAAIAERDEQLKNAFREVNKGRYLDRIERELESDPAGYELLRADSAASEVFSLIDKYHAQTGEEMSVKEACQLCEETLAERYESTAKRIRSYKKLAPRLGWEAPEETQPADKAPAAPAPKTKTMSQADAPSGGPVKKLPGPEHPDDRWQALLEQRRRTLSR